jgi:hypothetical protein
MSSVLPPPPPPSATSHGHLPVNGYVAAGSDAFPKERKQVRTARNNLWQYAALQVLGSVAIKFGFDITGSNLVVLAVITAVVVAVYVAMYVLTNSEPQVAFLVAAVVAFGIAGLSMLLNRNPIGVALPVALGVQWMRARSNVGKFLAAGLPAIPPKSPKR